MRLRYSPFALGDAARHAAELTLLRSHNPPTCPVIWAGWHEDSGLSVRRRERSKP